MMGERAGHIEVQSHEHERLQNQGGDNDVHAGHLSTASKTEIRDDQIASHMPIYNALVLDRSLRFSPHLRLCGSCGGSMVEVSANENVRAEANLIHRNESNGSVNGVHTVAMRHVLFLTLAR